MKRLIAFLIVTLAAGVHASPGPDYALTIYSRAQPGAVDPGLYRPGRYQSGTVPGYAVVRQTQTENVEQGVSQLRVQDVASLIDPTTVSIRSLQPGDPVRVLEQNFEFDLVSSDKLLDRYLDRNIVVVRSNGQSVTGTLLSTDGGLVLQLPDEKVQIITRYEDAILPELPGGLITRPTLVWQVQASQAGERSLQISYQTEGMTWWADYNATLKEEDEGCSLDLNAWVSIVNQSGAGYPEAHLKLIAGDVQRLPRPDTQTFMERATVSKVQEVAGFREESFFEYHLYTLPHRTSVPNNSTKQLELFPAAQGITCSKEYLHDTGNFFPGYFSEPVLDRNPGWAGKNDVAVYLSFRNDTASGLGMPLPAGRMRVNKVDKTDGSLEFIGEDILEHTPRDEDVRVRLGNAFDIVVERKQVDFQVNTQSKTMKEAIELELRNHKETPVTVQIREVLYRWANWKLVKSSHDFEKLDARSIKFPVSVEPDETAKVRYEVQYSW